VIYLPTVKVTPKLNQIRKERGLSQIELAELSKVNQPFISKFDSNENFNANNVFSIARALGVSVEELFIIEEIPDSSEDDKGV
jgi:putative transcriptional regulator